MVKVLTQVTRTDAEDIIDQVSKLPYTGQAPPLTNEEMESLLEENNVARICTHNKDGTIHAIPVRYRYMNGQIVLLSYPVSQKTRNIKRNNGVTVLVDTGSAQGILIYGKAGLEFDNLDQVALSVWESSYRAPRDKLERFVQAALDNEYVTQCSIIFFMKTVIN